MSPKSLLLVVPAVSFILRKCINLTFGFRKNIFLVFNYTTYLINFKDNMFNIYSLCYYIYIINLSFFLKSNSGQVVTVVLSFIQEVDLVFLTLFFILLIAIICVLVLAYAVRCNWSLSLIINQPGLTLRITVWSHLPPSVYRRNQT